MKEKREKVVCKRCGYSWPKRVNEPKKCPVCSSYNWNKDFEEENKEEVK